MSFQFILSICVGGVIFSCLMFFVASRLAAILQQSGYFSGRMIKWYFGKGNIQRKRISLLVLALVLLAALFNLIFSFLGVQAANFLSALPVVGLFALYLYSEKKYALKVPANNTGRLLRLELAHLVILLIVSIGLGLGLGALSLALDETWFALFRFVPICLIPLCLPFTLALANGVMSLYEIPRNNAFIARAKKRLERAKCVKVGITGSFGKTSVKNFAAQMLKTKFKVIATPASFNTPMGIARTVYEEGVNCDIFLAEMGARHLGDIAELCDMINPEYGIVTGVCDQHIETFGSLENIKKEKSVLAKCVTKKAVLGKTCDFAAENALREDVDFAVKELVCTKDGISFTLSLEGEEVAVRSRLLGANAAEDIALAAALCHLLGMSLEEIAAAVGALEPVPHRLQKIEANGLTILDDSYNCNIAGAKNAVVTLKLFDGKKVVVTPGIVELGTLEEEMNEKLGAELAGLDVILVGETLVLPVRKGFLDAGGDEERLKVVPTLAEAQEILAKELEAGDTVLFLNDLPDIYR